MPMKIFAKSGGIYLLADGDPKQDNNLPTVLANTNTETRSVPVPLQQHLKFLYDLEEDIPDDPALARKLMALPIWPPP